MVVMGHHGPFGIAGGAAGILNLSYIVRDNAGLPRFESAIRNATLDGRLPFVRKYGRKLITAEELEAYTLRTRPDGVKPKGRPRRTEEEVSV